MTSRGATSLGTVLTVVAVVAVIAFMFWLYRESAELPVVDALADVEPTGITVTAADLLADPTGAIGSEVAIDSIGVVMGLGEAVFSLALDETTSYPVLLAPDMLQRFRMQQMRLYGGDAVSVYGRVFTLNDSIRVEWVNQGAVDRAMLTNLPRTSSFILADSVEVF
jgi:hypothetical protein